MSRNRRGAQRCLLYGHTTQQRSHTPPCKLGKLDRGAPKSGKSTSDDMVGTVYPLLCLPFPDDSGEERGECSQAVLGATGVFRRCCSRRFDGGRSGDGGVTWQAGQPAVTWLAYISLFSQTHTHTHTPAPPAQNPTKRPRPNVRTDLLTLATA